MKRLTLVLLLLFALFAIATPVALALPLHPADNCPDGPFDENGEPRNLSDCKCSYSDIGDETYCLSGEESLAVMIRDMIRMWLIGAAKGVAALFWLLIRIVATVCDALLQGEIWQDIRTSILGQLESILGGKNGVLYQIIGSSNGLFAIALMLAGLVMCFPLVTSGNSLVRVERVLPWGIILIALFISSSIGFDLIDAIDSVRGSMMQTAAGVGGEGASNLLNLVATPMLATAEEVLQIDAKNLWQLPAGFEKEYFPEPEYITRRVVISDLTGDVLDLVFRGEIIEPDSYRRLSAKTGEALFRIVISLLPLMAMGNLTLIFLIAYAAGLMLIVF